MNILVWMLILAAILLAVLVFMSPNKRAEKLKREKDPGQPGALLKDTEQNLISTLEDQLFSAKDELEKTKAGYVNIQEELDNVKKRELDLREELMRQKDWYDKKVEELDKLKNDYFPVKNKLDKEISQDLNLNKEIKEKDATIETLNKKNEELAQELQALKAQVKKQSPQ